MKLLQAAYGPCDATFNEILSAISVEVPHDQTRQAARTARKQQLHISTAPNLATVASAAAAMSTPSINLPVSPMASRTAQRPLHTRLANYSPPAIRQWVQSQHPQPHKRTIDCERFNRRLDLHKDGRGFPTSFAFLHPHFCLNSADRNLAYHEGISDIKDVVRVQVIYSIQLPTHLIIYSQVAGMDRTADVMHLSLSVRPEWDPTVPVHWSNIHVETVASRHFIQLPGWAGIADRITNIVRRELALAHVMQFREKLNQVTPRNGYLVDDETRAAMVGNLTIATEVDEAIPPLPQPSANNQPPPLSPSPLPSMSRAPSTLLQSRAPRATYVRVTSFSQVVEEANTPARAGERQAWIGNTPPSRVHPLRLPAPEHLGLDLNTPPYPPNTASSRTQAIASSSRIQAPALSLRTQTPVSSSHVQAPSSSRVRVTSSPLTPAPLLSRQAVVSSDIPQEPWPLTPSNHAVSNTALVSSSPVADDTPSRLSLAQDEPGICSTISLMFPL